MIIKDAANKQPWWQGMEGTCPECGTVVELDGTDSAGATLVDHKPGKVVHHCPTCHGHIEFSKPAAKTSTTAKGKKVKKK